jgi:mannose-6-phosphate isomerase-like protein (cupin superfamily)
LARSHSAVGIVDVPALDGRDDPAWWRAWARETPYGGQEEVYVVVRGRAAFVCDEEPVELGEGELLFVEPHVAREARALESPTTVLAIGGMPGSFEVWAEPETRP